MKLLFHHLLLSIFSPIIQPSLTFTQQKKSENCNRVLPQLIFEPNKSIFI